jgi:hypothetical protein
MCNPTDFVRISLTYYPRIPSLLKSSSQEYLDTIAHISMFELKVQVKLRLLLLSLRSHVQQDWRVPQIEYVKVPNASHLCIERQYKVLITNDKYYC